MLREGQILLHIDNNPCVSPTHVQQVTAHVALNSPFTTNDPAMELYVQTRHMRRAIYAEILEVLAITIVELGIDMPDESCDYATHYRAVSHPSFLPDELTGRLAEIHDQIDFDFKTDFDRPVSPVDAFYLIQEDIARFTSRIIMHDLYRAFLPGEGARTPVRRKQRHA